MMPSLSPMKASDIRILALLAVGAIAAGCTLPEAPAAEEESAEAVSAVQAPWVPGDCLTSASCAIGESCVGIPHDNSTIYGRCRSTAPLSGEGLSCSSAVSCQPDLACTGLSMGPDGTCAPAWMVVDYTNAAGRFRCWDPPARRSSSGSSTCPAAGTDPTPRPRSSSSASTVSPDRKRPDSESVTLE
jgi:hypothetical protein